MATCLRAVGYNRGNIQTWNGLPKPTYPTDTISLNLVLGGSSDTDPFMELFQQLPDTPLVFQLSTASKSAPGIPPEFLRGNFEQTIKHIESHLIVEFTDDEQDSHAICHWKKAGKAPRQSQHGSLRSYFPVLQTPSPYAIFELPTRSTSTV